MSSGMTKVGIITEEGRKVLAGDFTPTPAMLMLQIVSLVPLITQEQAVDVMSRLLVAFDNDCGRAIEALRTGACKLSRSTEG